MGKIVLEAVGSTLLSASPIIVPLLICGIGRMVIRVIDNIKFKKCSKATERYEDTLFFLDIDGECNYYQTY